jgi:hypothetical protein
MDLDDRFIFNGIDGSTGGPLFPPMTAREIFEGLQRRESRRVVMPGIDPRDLSQSGWGVVFHQDENPEVVEALQPLLLHRKAQATAWRASLYKEYSGPLGYHGPMDKEDFLAVYGAGRGPVNPKKVPYYLLIVGDPGKIPYSFQHQLDVQYAVGRICFDTPEEYERYALSVVAAEMGAVARERRAAFFGVRNPGDGATELSADRLVGPLAERFREPEGANDWQIQSFLAEEATRDRLGRLLGGEPAPAFLFTASHGMGFPPDDSRQREHQGALLCQDWPGPNADGVAREHYFAAEDLGKDASVHGLIAFFFACHGAGVPQLDEFAHRNNGHPPRQLAPEPFVSRLPQKLLAHPRGGALAVVGHVERAWGYAFLSRRSASQTEAFESTLELLMAGYPIGAAMEFFNLKYAEIAAELTQALQDIDYGKKRCSQELAELWTANNDAKSYAVVGDSAVRLAVAG